MGCGASQNETNIVKSNDIQLEEPKLPKVPKAKESSKGGNNINLKGASNSDLAVRFKQLEMITIGAGGVGTSCLQSFLNSIAIEHSLYDETPSNRNLLENINTFFSENREGKQMARGIIIDSGKGVLKNTFQKASISKLFYEENFVTNSEETENLYFLATRNKVLIEKAFEVIRKEAEKCDWLSGFQVFNSSGGGAGSGYSNEILDRISIEFGKKHKFRHTVIPSMSNSTPSLIFNTVFSLAKNFDYADLNNILCNDNMLKIVKKLPETNTLIGKMAADLSSLNRFSSNCTMLSLVNNLIPYPSVSMITTIMINPVDSKLKENQIIDKLYDDKNSLGYINSTNGKFISTYHIFRGNQQNNYELLNALKVKKSLLKVCNFSENICFSSVFTPAVKGNSCIRIANHSSTISELFQNIKNNNNIDRGNPEFYDKIIRKCVGEGMEEGEYMESLENLNSLIMDYEEVIQ